MAWTLMQGDVRERLAEIPEKSVQTCITSPPYWGLRSYLPDGHEDKKVEMGIESTPEEYVQNMVEVFRGVWRVLRDDGTVWLNLGDSYNANYRGGGPDSASSKQKSNYGTVDFMAKRAPLKDGIKPKDLVGAPWMVAFALRADGWYLRSDIIWAKPNPMPESVTDRVTKSHEYLFLMTKKQKYFYDAEAIREPIKPTSGVNMRAPKCGADRPQGTKNQNQKTYEVVKGANRRSVWTVATQPYPEAHFATFPPKLIEPCILAGSKRGDIVLDPFAGSGTTLWVAEQHGRDSIGIELNPEYCELVRKRMDNMQLNLFSMEVE